MKRRLISLVLAFSLTCSVGYVSAQGKEPEVPDVFSPGWSLVTWSEIKLSIEDGKGYIEMPFIFEFFYNKTTDKSAIAPANQIPDIL